MNHVLDVDEDKAFPAEHIDVFTRSRHSITPSTA
jgi:hypothetical protein